MKFKFESNLVYQNEAIAAVVDLFNEKTMRLKNGVFTISMGKEDLLNKNLGLEQDLVTFNEDLKETFNKIQIRNNVPQDVLNLDNAGYLNFDIEMETGTGKTYVYFKTIFELSKKGFKKFIIVVPSVAIKEGVLKTIEMTKDHFEDLYFGADNRVGFFPRPFIYDGKNLGRIREFAMSSNIEIMIVNIASFNKDSNILNQSLEQFNGSRGIDIIAGTRPVVIVDEPQSVTNSDKGENSVYKLRPCMILNYSATHIKKHNVLYKLDAVKAYNMNLVKNIEVVGITPLNSDDNLAYIRLVGVDNTNGISARVEINSLNKKGVVERKIFSVKNGDSLYELSGDMAVYAKYEVNNISCVHGKEFIDFTATDDVIGLGESVNDVNDLSVKRTQIRKTIEHHFKKELKFKAKNKNIKVLSLIFLDKVENYKVYNEDGSVSAGRYAKIFEEEYKKLMKDTKFNTLFESVDCVDVAKVHDGYFSKDGKTGKLKDTTERGSKDDESIYNLIMKDKEKLLSFDCPIKFIFSHSALKEGWDNPNVFQICTLNVSNSTRDKRQKIGRGLRLCVDSFGNRVYEKSSNILTVIANESFEEFAEGLQKEIEEDLGIKFNCLSELSFANMTIGNTNGEIKYFGEKLSKELFKFFKDNDYLDSKGKVKELLRNDLRSEESGESALQLPLDFLQYKNDIIKVIEQSVKIIHIENAEKEKIVAKRNKQIFDDPEFKELWNKIKQKTIYSLKIENIEQFINNCAYKFGEEVNKNKTQLNILTNIGSLQINNRDGVVIETKVNSNSIETLDNNLVMYEEYEDLIGKIEKNTNLKRTTIVNIIKKSETYSYFKQNPHGYINLLQKVIDEEKTKEFVNGISYTKIDDYYNCEEILENRELNDSMLKDNLTKSMYDKVECDSINEQTFIDSFENSQNIKMYFKLPNWFKIKTPLGFYNPDWAIVASNDDVYFVVLETKSNIREDELRPKENEKIKCAKKHFDSLNNGVKFYKADNFEKFITGLKC